MENVFMLVLAYRIKYTYRKYLSSFTASRIKENVELTKNSTDKTLPSLCRLYDNCLDTVDFYSRTIKQRSKTRAF